MSSFRYSCFVFAIAFVLTSCAEPEKPKAAVTNVNGARAGSGFNQIGKVSLYPGESCATQIMFVLNTGGSTSISLAAPMKQSKILTEAVHNHRSVRVKGRWRRGGMTTDCFYVEATQVEVQKSFW